MWPQYVDGLFDGFINIWRRYISFVVELRYAGKIIKALLWYTAPAYILRHTLRKDYVVFEDGLTNRW